MSRFEGLVPARGWGFKSPSDTSQLCHVGRSVMEFSDHGLTRQSLPRTSALRIHFRRGSVERDDAPSGSYR